MPASASSLPPRNPPGACRHAALAVRRDLRGAVPHPGLCLRQLRAGRAALQERGAGLPVFALRQSDRHDVRAAHGGVRRRGGRARDRDRHGGGDARAASASSRPAITWSRRRRCSAPAATWSRTTCRATASPRRWSTAPISTQWQNGGAAEHQDRSSSKARPIRRSKCSTSPRSPRSRTRPARRWWSTTCSRRRCSSARSSSAPTASSIRRPSTSTARAAASAASSSARRNSSRTTCTICIRQTGPSMSPFNAWVLLKGLETLPRARAPADRHARPRSRSRSPSIRRSRALIYPGRPDHPQAEIAQEADARRLDAGRVRGRGRQGRRVPLPGRAQARAHLATISATPRA